LTVRKVREVLRLDSLGLSQRQIALSCCVGQATVSDYLKAAEQAGLKWPEIAEWGEERLLAALTPAGPAAPRRTQWPEPDYAAIRQELQTHKHVTLQLLWEEYREQHPDGYAASGDRGTAAMGNPFSQPIQEIRRLLESTATWKKRIFDEPDSVPAWGSPMDAQRPQGVGRVA
jgi:transposase